jgi:hypothetical protein
MNFIKGRLKRLEERGGRCPECGLKPDDPGRIVYTGEGAPGEGFQGDPEERCTRCWRFLYTVIEVVYEDEGEGA